MYDIEFKNEILSRKEFNNLAVNENNKIGDLPTIFELAAEPHGVTFIPNKLRKYQIFVRNFMNPNTPYKRLHLKWSTGTGKTNGACAIANEYVKIYRDLCVECKNTRRQDYSILNKSTPNIFILGFRATEEAFQKELLNNPDYGFITIDEKMILIEKKNKSSSGQQDSIQEYKEYKSYIKRRITNKIKGGFYCFIGYDELVNKLFPTNLSKIKLTELEQEINNRNKEDTDNILSLEDAVIEKIKTGDLVVDDVFLKQFENSLIIADEIHNTYNMNNKNNRGVALQYILDSIKTVSFLSLSATPISTSPSEVVDFLNYLIPNKIYKHEFFKNNKLLPNALEKLGELSYGRISFLEDYNPDYYPNQQFIGDSIDLPYEIYEMKTIPYLKFIKCYQPKLLQETFLSYEKQIRNEYPDIEFVTPPIDGYAIYDIVFPGPNETGLFRTNDIKNALLKSKNNNFLLYKNLMDYSAKFTKMLEILFNVVNSGNPRKVLIYHNRVKTSGVLLIQEILNLNGFIEGDTEPSDNSLCCICGITKVKHKNTHEYKAARYLIAHSGIDSTTLMTNLTKYDLDNTNGTRYMILVGSELIKESYDFKAIQELIITSLPINIPTLMQIIGRAVRNNSHIELPTEKRMVNIHILVSVVNEQYKYLDKITPELRKYAKKVFDFIIIQNIEREFNKRAIDAGMHFGNKISPKLGQLPFEPIWKLPTLDLKYKTYDAYQYNEEEIKNITIVIKQLFMKTPVWKLDELITFVKNVNEFEFNPNTVTDGNIVIALSRLIETNVPHENKKLSYVSQLLNYEERQIVTNNGTYKICNIGDLYIRFPVDIYTGKPIVDVETYMRYNPIPFYQRVSINDVLKKIYSKPNINIEAINKKYENNVIDFITDEDNMVQKMYIETEIKNAIETGIMKITPIIELLSNLDIILYVKEIKKYTNITKLFKNGFPDIKDNIPIGYITEDSVKLYDPAWQWFEVNKVAVNRQIKYKEYIVVGYLEKHSNGFKFKTRPATFETKDSRLLEKGEVCFTKTRDNLKEIMKKLGMTDKQINKTDNLRIKEVCGIIKEKMINLEIVERSKMSKIKHFYYI